MSASSAAAQGWHADLAEVPVPKEKVSGLLFGEALELGRARVVDNVLMLAGETATISIPLPEAWSDSVANKSLSISRQDSGQALTVESGQQATSYQEAYALELLFSKPRDDGKILGRIYLSLPDREQGWVAGYFRARVDPVAKQEDRAAEALVSKTSVADADTTSAELSPARDLEAARQKRELESLFEPTPEITEPEQQSIGSASIIALLFLGLGLAINTVGGLWMLVAAFRESFLWGLGMFLPFVGLVFLVVHWRVAMKPFLVSIAGIVVMLGGLPFL